jgi:amino acid adenylation domain-containing protein
LYLTNLTQYLDKLVKICPERAAVYEGERSLTMAALRLQSLKAAREISARLEGGLRRIVAVYLPKSIDSVVTDIGVIYSGNAYMNLDIKYPAQRLGNILGLIQPALVITREALVKQLKEVPNCAPILTLEEIEKAASLTTQDQTAVLSAREAVIDTDPLCIINTSGSTGTPKGVVLNHRSFIDFTECVIEAGLIHDEEVVASLSPLVFDIYSFELCAFMAKGSTLLLVPDSLAAFPVRILELMAQHKATFIFWVPTIMVNIANMDLLSQIPLPNLKMVWFAGEVFPTAKFNYWRTKLPQATFANFYGPIEITLDCVYYVVNRELRDDEPIPIGIPFKNTDILILDENDQPARPGQEGELCVRGSSLALGYYNSPEQTAAAFVQNPLNQAYPELIYRTGDIVLVNERGELVFKGRKDTLIKHLGYRIELAEIEHMVIDTLKLAKNCCAIHNREEQRITLIYEAPEPQDEKSLRAGLGRVLPRYMVPTTYMHMTELPRNINGKIDRQRLKEMFVTSKT